MSKFNIKGFLCHGGSSLLYLAEKKEDTLPIILKILDPKHIHNQELKKKFLHEGDILSTLSHPNIIRYIDHGTWETTYFLALEYVQGTSLRKYLRHHTLSLKNIYSIILALSQTLIYLQEKNIIHMDIKPENILISNKTIKLIDFGISKNINKKEPCNHFLGTPLYMSPEQQKDPENITFASDVYALGLVAYEMYTRSFFHQKATCTLFPEPLRSLVQGMLIKDPKERLSAIAVVQALAKKHPT